MVLLNSPLQKTFGMYNRIYVRLVIGYEGRIPLWLPPFTLS